MDEDTKIWDKKMDDMTVKNHLVLTAAAPIITIAALAAAHVVTDVTKNAIKKFRSRKTTTETTTTN